MLECNKGIALTASWTVNFRHFNKGPTGDPIGDSPGGFGVWGCSGQNTHKDSQADRSTAGTVKTTESAKNVQRTGVYRFKVRFKVFQGFILIF